MQELINKAKEEQIELEIYSEHTKEDLIHVFGNVLKQYEASDITTYSLKCLYQGKTITLNVEDISDYKKIICLIKESAQLVENNDENMLSKLKTFVGKKGQTKTFDGNKVKNKLLSFYERQTGLVKSIETEVAHTRKEIIIQNQYGSMSEVEEYVTMYAEAVVTDKDENYDGVAIKYLKEYDEKEVENLVDKAINTAMSKIGAISIKTGTYNVLFDHKVVAQFLKSFSEAFSAKKIQEKQSVLEEKDYKNKIFSELITIVEDPLNEEFVGKRTFDIEGTFKKYQIIVNQGILENKMHNVRTALKEKTESTGNCDCIRNFYILPGNLSKDTLIEKMETGIMITNVEGLHSGINKKTGHISVQAQGYQIENGKITNPLNMIVLTMNFKDFLSSVKAVGNDLTQYDLSYSAPSILCNNIAISGTVK